MNGVTVGRQQNEYKAGLQSPPASSNRFFKFSPVSVQLREMPSPWTWYCGRRPLSGHDCGVPQRPKSQLHAAPFQPLGSRANRRSGLESSEPPRRRQ